MGFWQIGWISLFIVLFSYCQFGRRNFSLRRGGRREGSLYLTSCAEQLPPFTSQGESPKVKARVAHKKKDKAVILISWLACFLGFIPASVLSFIFRQSFFLIQPDFFSLFLFWLSLTTRLSPPTSTHRQRPSSQQSNILLSSTTSSTSAESSLLLSLSRRLAHRATGSVGVQHPRVGSSKVSRQRRRSLTQNSILQHLRRLDFLSFDSFLQVCYYLKERRGLPYFIPPNILFFPTSLRNWKTPWKYGKLQTPLSSPWVPMTMKMMPNQNP